MKKLILFFAIVCVIFACNNKTKNKNNLSIDSSDNSKDVYNKDKIENEASTQTGSSFYVITNKKVDFVEIGDSLIYKIPKNISYEYSSLSSNSNGKDVITNKVILRDLSGDLMKVILNEKEIVQEIEVYTTKAGTDKNIGVGSKLNDVIIAYPDYKICYIKNSHKIILESASLTNIQFILAIDDFKGNINQLKFQNSNKISLKPSEFEEGTVIRCIRIY